MDGAGPFCASVPKHPNSHGGILEVAATDRGELAPAFAPPAPHIEAQAVHYTSPGAEPIVAAREQEAPTIFAPMPAVGIRSPFLPKLLGK